VSYIQLKGCLPPSEIKNDPGAGMLAHVAVTYMKPIIILTVYSILTCTKFDLHQTFQNINIAQVEECLYKRKRRVFINSCHFQSVVHDSSIRHVS